MQDPQKSELSTEALLHFAAAAARKGIRIFMFIDSMRFNTRAFSKQANLYGLAAAPSDGIAFEESGFTKAIVQSLIRTPGITGRALAHAVSIAVEKTTGGKQSPVQFGATDLDKPLPFTFAVPGTR